MKNYHISFINNKYAIKKEYKYYEYDTNPNSEKMTDFVNSIKPDFINDLLNIEIEAIVPVDDLFIEQAIDSYLEFYLEEESLKMETFVSKESLTTIYIDLDNTVFKYSERKAEMIKKCPKMIFPQANYGFFANLEPFDGAVKTIKKLMMHPNFEVMFATAPSILNPMSYAEKRVSIEKHFGIEACEDLIIISKKNKLDDYDVFLIDDMETGNGQDLFEKGTHLLYGSEKYPDWEAIDEFFFGL